MSLSSSLPVRGYVLGETTEWILLLFLTQAMESKLLVGGKNIVDHTNEQQKILEQKRQEIAEQVTLHSYMGREACTNIGPQSRHPWGESSSRGNRTGAVSPG